jgi:hypothetical protein
MSMTYPHNEVTTYGYRVDNNGRHHLICDLGQSAFSPNGGWRKTTSTVTVSPDTCLQIFALLLGCGRVARFGDGEAEWDAFRVTKSMVGDIVLTSNGAELA